MVYVDLLTSQDDSTVHARVLNLGQGVGKGLFCPLQVGDEVVVLFPHGDLNQGIVIGGIGNGVAVNPVQNTGVQMLAQHPGGVKLNTTEGQPLHGIVHGQFLVEANAFLSDLMIFLGIVATATTAPQIATAASTFIARPSVLTMIANLAASAGSGTPPGVGGPPYSTALHKVSP